MTPQQAKEEFDKLKENKVFKKTFLFWEQHKNLIQKSFTKLQNELNELVGKEDQKSRCRIGNIFRELESIKPLPESEEDKAFVAKYWIDLYQKRLETDKDPIYSFDDYRQVFENKSKSALNLKDFIATEQKRMSAILDKVIWQGKIKLEHDEIKTLKDFILGLTDTLTIDYAFIYEYVDKHSYNVDYLKLAMLLAPAQYSNFLKSKLDTLQDSKPEAPAPPATEQPTKTKEFDNNTLTQIMNDDMIDLFLENEKRLRAEGFITSENKWINGRGKNQERTLKDLANLIIVLSAKKYFKDKFNRKKVKESDYKKFFEARYGCNLKEQFNEAIKDRTKRLETSQTTFIWF